jgi:hypothetical protein
MGVTIRYRGTLRDPGQIDAMIDEVRALVEPWGWELRPCEIASRRVRITALAGGAHAGRAVAGRLLGEFRARGFVLFPHFACDPMPFLVETHSGLLVDLEPPAEGSEIQAGASVKTQFAPTEVHERVSRLLYEIRERFIQDLDVVDEGGYFRTGDLEGLEEARRAVERQIAERATEAAVRGAAWRVGFRVPRGEGFWRILDFVLGTEKDPRFSLASTVPDRLEEGGTLAYVKRAPSLWLNDQIRLVIEACLAHGKRFRLVVPKGASLSEGLRETLASTDRFTGIEEADPSEDAGLYLAVLDTTHEIDYGGIEVGRWSQFEKYRGAIHDRLEKRFLRRIPVGKRFPLFLTRSAGGWSPEELPSLKQELETILEEAARRPADPLIVPEYASRVRSRFRALHHCFVDTQVEPLLEKLLALCDVGISKRLPVVMQ